MTERRAFALWAVCTGVGLGNMHFKLAWNLFILVITLKIQIFQCLMHYWPYSPSSTTTTTHAPISWTWSPDCGDYWVKDSTSGYCYHFSNTSLIWSQAQTQCRKLGTGSQLASINSPDEQHFIEKHLYGFQPPGLWIGVNTLNTETGYHWSDGSPFSFLNWSPGEPNNVFNNEHCGEIVTNWPPTRGKWNDNDCSSLRGYICKKSSPGMTTLAPPQLPPTPSGYFYGCAGTQWRPYKENCYLFNTPGTSWANATQYCVLQGGKLASIADENEQNFVLSQLPARTDRSQYWIGLNDILTQMNFMWNDGSPVRYTNWAENEPNNYMGTSEDCVGMFLKDGTWNDENCMNSLSGFVCKARKKLLRVGAQQYNQGTGCSVRNSLALGYNCYLFKDSLKTWSAAQIYCKAFGGNLAFIQDRYQQAFLSSQIAGNTGNYWIGLNNGGNSSVTGETVDFTAWSANFTTANDKASHPLACIAMKTESPGVGLWVGANCAVANKYICQYPRTGFSTPITTTTPSTAPRYCPSTWHTYNGYCYKAYSQESDKRTWWAARDFCKALGADLISLHSSAEETFAFSYTVIQSYSYNANYWIGAHDLDVEKGYKWSDGSTWAYTNWKAGEPNDIGGNDDCVERYQSTQNWNDNNCYVAKRFVCKMQLGQQLRTLPPTVATTASASCASTPGWLPYNGSCYYMSEQYGLSSTKTWFDARLFCMQHGGDLASVHSEQENGFITTMVSSKDFDSWVGLTMVGSGSFGWSDGTLLDYDKWLPGEPSNANGNEHCGRVYAFSGYWDDRDCNELYHFVCKRPQGKVIVHTPSPTPLVDGGCPQGFTGIHKDNKCLKVFGTLQIDRKNYTEARNHCIALGGDLASINSHIELVTIISLIDGLFPDEVSLWIGMSDTNHYRRFTWQDGSPLLITNWAKGQPGYGYQNDCVELYTDERRAGKWGNTVCSRTRGYICESTRKTTFPTSAPSHGSCQSGYLPNAHSDCFKVYTTPKSWAQAKSSCQSDGTSLVSILSVFDQAFVDLLTADISTPVWIGLADERNTSTYSWVDKWEVFYTSWDKNEPTHTAGEGCVATQGGYWNDTVCSNAYPYICKKSKLTPPTPTISSGYCADNTWRQFRSSCYYLALSAYKSWAESERECKSRGMELASILNKEELLFILREIDYSPVSSTDVWIGLIRHIDGHFIWSDGSALSYLPWDDGQPSNSSSSTYTGGHMYSYEHEDCVELKYTNGKWNDATCSSTKGFVCKTAKLPSTSAHSSAATQQPAIVG